MGCQPIISVRVVLKGTKPSYETLSSFGSNCGISDIKAVAKANEICDENTLDTISTGMMISGAMECAEKGLLPRDFTKDLDLRFGSTEGMFGLLNQIINRQGLGNILAEGPKDLEEKLGKEAASCFHHVKGQPVPLHEPRWKTGLGLGYALSPTGAEHVANVHDHLFASEEAPTFTAAQKMGILDAVGALELSPAKARLWVYMTLARSISNSACVCVFMPYSSDQIADHVKAVTGWNITHWELLKATERALNMARAFNAREGFRADTDMLPDRFFEPLEGGALEGKSIDRQQFVETRRLVYDMLGWDPQTG